MGRGRKDSPALLLERTTRRIELDEFAFAGQTGKACIGYRRPHSKCLSERDKILDILKKESERKRLSQSEPY